MAKKKTETIVDESIDLVSVVGGTEGYKKTEVCVKQESSKQNPFKELMDAVFKGNVHYINNITDQQAKQNLFIILRKTGIGYPLIANSFNNSCVNAKDTMMFISLMFSRLPFPKWIFTPNPQTEKTSSKKDVTRQDIEDYKSFYGICTRDFESAMKLFPEETVKDIMEHKTFIKNLNNLKNGKENIDNE